MKKRTFFVAAVWDDEAKAFISKSDIIGLHIEANTLEEFERLVGEFAPDLIVANHMSESDLKQENIRDVIPAILMKPPVDYAEFATS